MANCASLSARLVSSFTKYRFMMRSATFSDCVRWAFQFWTLMLNSS